MSKINQNKNSSSISQGRPKGSITDTSRKTSLSYDEKGFYWREVRLLINEGGFFITTENSDNLLLEIENRDTIQVSSTISGKEE